MKDEALKYLTARKGTALGVLEIARGVKYSVSTVHEQLNTLYKEERVARTKRGLLSRSAGMKDSKRRGASREGTVRSRST